jgi:hypothetical protein
MALGFNKNRGQKKSAVQSALLVVICHSRRSRRAENAFYTLAVAKGVVRGVIAKLPFSLK